LDNNHRKICGEPQQRLVINRLFDGFKGFLSTSKYAKLAKCSTDTALRDIQELLERGVLIQNPGGGRSTGTWRPASARTIRTSTGLDGRLSPWSSMPGARCFSSRIRSCLERTDLVRVVGFCYVPLLKVNPS
jgi:hypothetical protein